MKTWRYEPESPEAERERMLREIPAGVLAAVERLKFTDAPPPDKQTASYARLFGSTLAADCPSDAAQTVHQFLFTTAERTHYYAVRRLIKERFADYTAPAGAFAADCSGDTPPSRNKVKGVF